jgi:hypothetical protein
MIQLALAGALASVRAAAGISIVYSDGAHPVTINAGVGQTLFEIADGEVIVETWTSRAFLMARADLVLNNVAVLPAKGHTIVATINGVSKTFAVLAPQGKQVYEFSDPGQTQLRVHTKEIV